MEDRIIVAKNIKKELNVNFKGHKFSVTSCISCGNTMINVEWTSGPSIENVANIIDKYQRGSFNSFNDTTDILPNPHNLKRVDTILYNRK